MNDRLDGAVRVSIPVAQWASAPWKYAAVVVVERSVFVTLSDDPTGVTIGHVALMRKHTPTNLGYAASVALEIATGR